MTDTDHTTVPTPVPKDSPSPTSPAAPTLEQLQASGATTSLTTAAQLFGLSRATAYRLARTGRFPVPVLRAGNQYRVPVAPIIAALHPTSGTTGNQPPPTAAAAQ